MFRRVCSLAILALAGLVALAWAEDEITVRSKEKPYKGVIKSESPAFVEIGKEKIPAEDIVDIKYEITPIDVRINLYNPAIASEKEFNDPDPKKESKRRANLADAIKKYADAQAKVKEKNAKVHLEYKVAVLTMRKLQDENGDMEPVIKSLSAFKTRHPKAWQITSCLQLLGKLQVDAKLYKDAEETYTELASANVPEDTRQDAALLAAQVSAKAGKYQEALKKLQAFEAKLPKDSKFQGRVKIAQAECLIAAKDTTHALGLLRQVTEGTADKALKAMAYNTMGLLYFDADQPKEARWPFLWVDVVYNQDKAEHAKALYYLAKVFDKLEEKERAQECRDTLLNDRAFTGMPWQRLALKEAPKTP